MVPFAHHLVDWEDILSKGWFHAELETLEKIFPALDVSKCVVLDDDFLCCSNCSSSWMLISLKSDLKSFVSDLGDCWCTLFQTSESLGKTGLWSQMRGMVSWGYQYLYMGSVQALTSGHSYALSSTYDWDSEPLLSMVHHSKVFEVGTIRDFRSLHGCIRIIQLRPSRFMWSYGDEVVELLQRIVFIFARRFGEATFTVMAPLDTLGRYVVEFDCESCRLYFLLPRLVIDSGIIDIDYSELYGHEMLHDIDFNPSRFFSLSIMDGNILELPRRLVQFGRDPFIDVIRLAQYWHGGFFLRRAWDPGIVLAFVRISLKKLGVVMALLEDKQFWEGQIVMSPSPQ
ncbi:hypothetical protein SUGI_0263620 [Cryptomeria japonica]|nr:hypothetical protein SUGI_0263620 [Cryptomeria japonica]